MLKLEAAFLATFLFESASGYFITKISTSGHVSNIIGWRLLGDAADLISERSGSSAIIPNKDPTATIKPFWDVQTLEFYKDRACSDLIEINVDTLIASTNSDHVQNAFDQNDDTSWNVSTTTEASWIGIKSKQLCNQIWIWTNMMSSASSLFKEINTISEIACLWTPSRFKHTAVIATRHLKLSTGGKMRL